MNIKSQDFMQDLRNLCHEQGIKVASRGELDKLKQRCLAQAPPIDVYEEDTFTFNATDGVTKILHLAAKLEEKGMMTHHRKGERYRVKVSGDGARQSYSKSMVFLTLSLLDADHPHSRAANVTVAIGSSNETYDALDSMFRASLKPHPRIEYFFSSDLKFLRVVLGQPGCSAKFFCSHCEAPHINKARYDPTKSQVRDMEPEFTLIPWDPAEPWRTCGQNEHYLRSVDRCAFLLDHGGKNNMGQIKKPIIIMEFECIVPDTLHLMMRSLEKLVHEIAVHLFYGAKQHTTARSNTGVGRPTAESARYRRQVVADFAAAISEVLDRKFSFAWKDGFPDRPSFIGHDCEKFCRAAPEILLSDAYRPYHQAIDSYCSIFSMLMRSNRNVTDDDIHSLEQHIKTFASEIMHSTCLERLPNSIHVLRYHVMPYVRRYRSTLLEFSQQGVEAMIGGYRRALQNTSKRDANARLRALLEHDNIVCMWPKHKEPLKCASCRQTGHGNATSHQCPKNKSKRQPSATPTRAKQGTFAGQMYSLYQ